MISAARTTGLLAGHFVTRRIQMKIGAKVVAHSRYVFFQMAEVAVPKQMFRAILERIRRLRPPETVPG